MVINYVYTQPTANTFLVYKHLNVEYYLFYNTVFHQNLYFYYHCKII